MDGNLLGVVIAFCFPVWSSYWTYSVLCHSFPFLLHFLVIRYSVLDSLISTSVSIRSRGEVSTP
jgi:hypothetical protein